MPAILPARALPRAMGANTHIIQKEQLARKDRRLARCSYQLLISFPLREPTPVVKWLTTGPLPLSGQGKQRRAQMWHLGFGKVLTVKTGCYTRLHTRVKLWLQEKPECLHVAWCFRPSSSVLIQHQGMSRKSNRCSPPTSGYSLFVATSWQMS